jgi:hypothetical protein
VSVPMEDKVEKEKGRRVTVNSSGLTTRSVETSLEKALRKSQKEQRRLEKKKAKEDKELERVLELSKRDMGRIESESHLLKLRSSSPPSPPVLTLLGHVEGKERPKRERVGPFSGVPESDLDIEYKDQDPNHPSNRLLLGTLSPVPPEHLTINSLMDNAFGLVFEPTGSDTRTDRGENQTDESDDSDDDDGVTVTLDSEMGIPEPRKQALLDELEIQYQFNKTMARYAGNQEKEGQIISSAQHQVVEPKNESVSQPSMVETKIDSPSLTAMVDPTKRSPSLSATELLLQNSSSELEDPSEHSDQSKNGGRITSSDTTSSTDSVVVTQNMCDTLREGADTWADEEDVLRAMSSLSLSASKVTISRKTLAGMFFESRPPPCGMKQLLDAQEQSFEVARKDLEKRLLEVRISETKKMKKPRQELDQLILDYEEKLRVLNLRIQASEVFQNETTDVTSQMEVALDDALTENRSLKEQVKNLKGILNDMFLHGNMPVASKNKGELTIKPSPSPASSSSCVDASPRSCSSASESSSASPLHDSRTKDKRDRSPTTKIEKEFDFKKPRPRCQLHHEWQNAGNKAATEFINRVSIRQFLITKTKNELENFIPRIMKAADDFRDMFPNFFDTDSSLAIKLRNEESHPRFASLQSELMIPTLAQGRKFALSFYYGKILGDIKDILKQREQFQIAPNDHRKIRDYIHFLGEDHMEVRQFRLAEENSRHITKDTQHFRESFRKQFLALLEPNSPCPSWIHQSLFFRIRGQDQNDKVACNLLYDQARILYMDYHYFLYLHTTIQFYSQARARAARTFFTRRPNNTNGGGPQGSN